MVNAIARRADTSILRQQRIMGYGIPVAIDAGIDPDQAIAEMGAAEQIFGATTRVGTGYSQFLLGALHVGGGINAHLARARKEGEKHFEEALKLEGGDVAGHRASMHGSAHDAALRALGITNSRGDLQDVTATGALDEQRIKEQIATYARTHSSEEVVNTLTGAFGVQEIATRHATPSPMQWSGKTGQSAVRKTP